MHPSPQAITWADVDPYKCRDKTPPGRNELTFGLHKKLPMALSDLMNTHKRRCSWPGMSLLTWYKWKAGLQGTQSLVDAYNDVASYQIQNHVIRGSALFIQPKTNISCKHEYTNDNYFH